MFRVRYLFLGLSWFQPIWQLLKVRRVLIENWLSLTRCNLFYYLTVCSVQMFVLEGLNSCLLRKKDSCLDVALGLLETWCMNCIYVC